LSVLYLPPWDCLPFDRAPPSRDIMGHRIAVLQALQDKGSTRTILVAAAEALLQRVPPAQAIADEMLALAVGDRLDRDALQNFAERTGYVLDDRIDEAGEIAFRGNVVDVFPADADHPVRITDQDGEIVSIARFDPASQRTIEDLSAVTLRPASELIAPPEHRQLGAEHRIAAAYEGLQTLFDYLPEAQLLLGTAVAERVATLVSQISEAHETARNLGETELGLSGLYLDEKDWIAACNARTHLQFERAGLAPSPDFSNERSPGRALADFAKAQAKAKTHLVLAASPARQRRLRAILQRNNIAPSDLPGGLADLPKKAGVWLADFELPMGFIDTNAHLALVTAADVLGTDTGPAQSSRNSLNAVIDLQVGDVVVHEDHGVGVLEDLTRIEVDGIEQDTIRLRYHDDASLMVPVGDFGKLWRYGAEVDAVKLDRLNTEAWSKKRAEVSIEIDKAAKTLASLAAERLAAQARVIEPPRAAFQRFAARFPFHETPDQAVAISAVLDDLASGRPMNRLVCGDVGFGKTEIALRAAAAVALAGQQVAMVAPTTVLARQHLESFKRRFAGTGIAVGQLSRLNTPAETKAVKDGLRSGDISVVIATHAIAAEDVELPELGLVII
ncbi:MAG TPA: CarD family transcriptional regulator, partial [Devosia sp.]